MKFYSIILVRKKYFSTFVGHCYRFHKWFSVLFFFTNLSILSILVDSRLDSLLLIFDFAKIVSSPLFGPSIILSSSSEDSWLICSISIGGSTIIWIFDFDFLEGIKLGSGGAVEQIELFSILGLVFRWAVSLLTLILEAFEVLLIDPGSWNSRPQLKHVKSFRQTEIYCDNKMQTFRR